MNPYTRDDEPLPVPGVHPLTEPRVTLQINEAWIPYLLGAFEFMRNPGTWAGTAAEVDETIQQAADLLAEIAGA